MHPALERTQHRPWQLPKSPWTWRQTWCDLLFAHWPVPIEVMRPLVPEPLEVQECEGSAWIGLVPFRMEGVMRRFLPDLPGISAFPELNVRTYVQLDGKPGVWFFSLDATNPLAIWAARRFFHLPYYRADMSLDYRGPIIQYRSERRGSGERLLGTYAPRGDVYESSPGSLEHFLTERYCLYAFRPDGTVLRNDVHHVPWPLQRAEADFEANTMFQALGIPAEAPPALLHFARKLEVVVWNAEVCRR